jgi:transcriptional regulator with XRE-family HTH domain
MQHALEIRHTRPGWCWVIFGPHLRAFPIDALAEYLGVTTRTVRRWISGAPVPHPAKLALYAAVGLFTQPGWEGFVIDRDGSLWSPNGYHWQPGELIGWPIIVQAAASIHGYKEPNT